VRVINLAGREKDKTLSVKDVGQLTLSPDGKAFGFVVTDISNPNQPAVMVKVIDAKGAAKSAIVSSSPYASLEFQRGVSFRPDGTDIAVRTGDGTVLVVDGSKLK
jgi:hypothetical protein